MKLARTYVSSRNVGSFVRKQLFRYLHHERAFNHAGGGALQLFLEFFGLIALHEIADAHPIPNAFRPQIGFHDVRLKAVRAESLHEAFRVFAPLARSDLHGINRAIRQRRGLRSISGQRLRLLTPDANLV